MIAILDQEEVQLKIDSPTVTQTMRLPLITTKDHKKGGMRITNTLTTRTPTSGEEITSMRGTLTCDKVLVLTTDIIRCLSTQVPHTGLHLVIIMWFTSIMSTSHPDLLFTAIPQVPITRLPIFTK
jgi:hypothetical protein